MRADFNKTPCIIPASGYYEWQQQESGEQPYYIKPTDQAIAFAGLYKQWDTEAEPKYSCTLLTTEGHPSLGLCQ